MEEIKADLKLRVIEDSYVEKPKGWHSDYRVHRNKNYIAEINGTDQTYGFSRRFLEYVKLGDEIYFQKRDFVEGNIYEFKCVYCGYKGKEDIKLEGFFRCVSTVDFIAFVEVGREETIAHAVRLDTEKARRLAETEETELIQYPSRISVRDLSNEEIATLMAILIKEMRMRGMGVQVV